MGADFHIKNDSENHNKAVQQIINDAGDFDIIAILGDFVHSGIKAGSKTEDYVADVLKILVDTNKPVYILAGTLSHDMNWFNSPFIQKLFKEKITFIDKPSIITNDNKRLLFIPEMYKENESLQNYLQDDSIDISFFHGTVADMVTYKLDNEDKLERNHPREKVFNSNEFPSPFTFCGHYHNYKEMNPVPDKKVVYIGSLFTNTFGEIDVDGKGMVIFDTDTKEIKRIANKFDNKFVEKEVLEFSDLNELAQLKNEGVNVRALITNDTPIALEKLIVKTLGNKYKNISTIEKEQNEKLDETTLKKYEEYEKMWKDKGMVAMITSFACENGYEVTCNNPSKVEEIYNIFAN